MAVTDFREDHLGRDLVAPTVDSLDWLGRATTATIDYLGRPLRRVLRANVTAVALDDELAFVAGTKYIVTIAGNTAAAEPADPAVGATVADGTATLLRQK